MSQNSELAYQSNTNFIMISGNDIGIFTNFGTYIYISGDFMLQIFWLVTWLEISLSPVNIHWKTTHTERRTSSSSCNPWTRSSSSNRVWKAPYSAKNYVRILRIILYIMEYYGIQSVFKLSRVHVNPLSLTRLGHIFYSQCRFEYHNQSLVFSPIAAK